MSTHSPTSSCARLLLIRTRVLSSLFPVTRILVRREQYYLACYPVHLSDYPVDISAAVTANVPADIAANASADADAVAMRSLDARAVAPTLNFDKSFWIWTGEKPVPLGVRPFRKIVPPSSTKCPVCATIIISRSVFIFRWKRRTHTLILVTILIPSL